MMKDNVFTKYDLETGTPDEIQFEIMEMPHFFCENGEAQSQAHIHGFLSNYMVSTRDRYSLR